MPDQESESLEKPSRSFPIIIQADKSPDLVFHVVLQMVVLAQDGRKRIGDWWEKVAFVMAGLACGHVRLAHDK